MNAYELMYRLRASCERAIVECDIALKARPLDTELVIQRRFYAGLAARFHARIERLELSYAQ